MLFGLKIVNPKSKKVLLGFGVSPSHSDQLKDSTKYLLKRDFHKKVPRFRHQISLVGLRLSSNPATTNI